MCHMPFALSGGNNSHNCGNAFPTFNNFSHKVFSGRQNMTAAGLNPPMIGINGFIYNVS
jgi:hypothetical protein